MPMATEKLTRQSSDDAIRQAISDTISMLMDEGREQKQAIAIAMQSARDHAGRTPGKSKPKDKIKQGIAAVRGQ